MEKYICPVCGFIYDKEIGDRDNGVMPGTEFEDLPEIWICPVCGLPKSEFQKLD